ncbi:MAG: hypothetical protein A2161_04360 [Candidatus Schekmanbacteria bacterium RBG_13_48_7]|uniref:Flagellar protein FliL n=1 Tax=Candidatus Schekmanbacteria bacterium RBG_13_48_7 TaxID=1817878 RepID=A0A1F7RS76_9BACT|nr:MAG: hypothetical protein A2161_04360 [Candidatus Schekmanbacteria bacterium RBG_13_48_7]
MDIDDGEQKETEQSAMLPSQKKFSIRFLITVLISLLMLCSAGILGWTYFMKTQAKETKPGESNNVPELTNNKTVEKTDVLNLNPFIVNLADSSGKRYLKVKIQLEVEKSLISEVDTNPLLLARIRDKILMILTTKTFDEILNIKGKILLRKEIIIRLNEFLKNGMVKNVYFTEFVVQ